MSTPPDLSDNDQERVTELAIRIGDLLDGFDYVQVMWALAFVMANVSRAAGHDNAKRKSALTGWIEAVQGMANNIEKAEQEMREKGLLPPDEED